MDIDYENLFSEYETDDPEYIKLPKTFIIGLLQKLTCNISHQLLNDAVVAKDGFTYEREAIKDWFKTKTRSPLTHVSIDTEVIESKTLSTIKNHILEYFNAEYLDIYMTKKDRVWSKNKNKLIEIIKSNDKENQQVLLNYTEYDKDDLSVIASDAIKLDNATLDYIINNFKYQKSNINNEIVWVTALLDVEDYISKEDFESKKSLLVKSGLVDDSKIFNHAACNVEKINKILTSANPEVIEQGLMQYTKYDNLILLKYFYHNQDMLCKFSKKFYNYLQDNIITNSTDLKCGKYYLSIYKKIKDLIVVINDDLLSELIFCFFNYLSCSKSILNDNKEKIVHEINEEDLEFVTLLINNKRFKSYAAYVVKYLIIIYINNENGELDNIYDILVKLLNAAKNLRVDILTNIIENIFEGLCYDVIKYKEIINQMMKYCILTMPAESLMTILYLNENTGHARQITLVHSLSKVREFFFRKASVNESKKDIYKNILNAIIKLQLGYKLNVRMNIAKFLIEANTLFNLLTTVEINDLIITHCHECQIEELLNKLLQYNYCDMIGLITMIVNSDTFMQINTDDFCFKICSSYAYRNFQSSILKILSRIIVNNLFTMKDKQVICNILLELQGKFTFFNKVVGCNLCKQQLKNLLNNCSSNFLELASSKLVLNKKYLTDKIKTKPKVEKSEYTFSSTSSEGEDSTSTYDIFSSTSSEGEDSTSTYDIFSSTSSESSDSDQEFFRNNESNQNRNGVNPCREILTMDQYSSFFWSY
jgi:hypothetical protein